MGDGGCKPDLTDGAALVLDRLLDGERFAIGRFDEVPDLEVYDPQTDEVSATFALPSTESADAVLIAGTKPMKRPRVPRTETEVRVRQYLLANGKSNPTISARAIAAATGTSLASVHKTSAWRAFEGERKKRRVVKPRTVPLTGDMLIVMPNVSAEDSADIAVANEDEVTMSECLKYADTTDERLRIKNKSPHERKEMFDAIREQQQDTEVNDCRPARRERSRRS